MAAAKTQAAPATPTSAHSQTTSAQSTNTSSMPAPATSSASRPIIPSAHQPTAAQQNPNVKRPLAPYLPEANPNAPKDPIQAMRERQNAAISSRMQQGKREEVASAPSGEDSASASTTKSTKPSTPTAATAASSASAAKGPPSSEASSTPSPSSETRPGTESGETSGQDTQDSKASQAKRGPRYEVKAMKKWAEENPEEAAELRTHVFGFDPSSNEGFIKLQNKRRKIREEITQERQRTVSEAQAERAAAKAAADQAEAVAGQLRPIVDMWEAGKATAPDGTRKPDFDAVDAAFSLNMGGMSIDDYVRARARRGVASPEQARLRAENARLQRELQARSSAPATPETKTSNGAAASAPSAAQGAPEAVKPAAAPADLAALEAKWSSDIPKTHKLRQLAGWAEKLESEMEKYHDTELDEYSRDPEEVANAILRRQIAELAGEDDEEAPEPAKVRAKPKAPPPAQRKRATFAPPSHAELNGIPSARDLTPRVASQRAHRTGAREGLADLGTAENPRDPFIRDRPERYSDRTQWAIARHQARARGEQVDDD